MSFVSVEPSYLTSLNNHHFQSVTSIIQFLSTVSPKERYQAQKTIADQLTIRRHTVEEELLSFLNYVVDDQI
jgi:hypothetical protein